MQRIEYPHDIQNAMFDSATGYAFDGMKMGDILDSVLKKSPFDSFCDIDPVAGRTKRIVFYAARDCKRVFPEGTSIVLYTAWDDTRMDLPIETIAYMHGNYFDTRSNFPLKIGGAFDKEAFRPERTVNVPKGRVNLDIHFYPGSDIFIITGPEDKTVECIIVGKMPEDLSSECWRMIAKLHHGYGPRRGP